MRIILKNDYHKTSIALNCKKDKFGFIILSAFQVKKSKRTLCGMAGCACGDVAGCRPRIVVEMQDGRGLIDCN